MGRQLRSPDSQNDCQLRRHLTEALRERLIDMGDPHVVTDIVMETLNDLGVVAFAPKGSLRLLSTHGRTLVAIMERPDITIRELAIYLGVSESNAGKSVQALVRNNVVTRTKVKGRNRYRINPEEAMYQPDIRRFNAAITTRFSPTN